MTQPRAFLRNSIAIPISREMALDYGYVAPTAEEAAERNESAARFRVQRAEARDAYVRAIASLNALTGVAERAVLTLHAPDDTGYTVVCSHCYYDTEMGDREDWPCETVEAVASAHGIPLPSVSVSKGDDREPYVWREGVAVEPFILPHSTAFVDLLD